MKLIRTTDDSFVFKFNSSEKQALVETLKSFPIVPLTHHKLSKSTLVATTENQELLEDALVAQRTKNQKEITAILTKRERLKWMANHWQFTVTRIEIELLLQVLNDVRVGSWLALGSPDLDREDGVTINEETLPHVLRMELAGHLEAFFIGSLNGDTTYG